MKTNKKLILSLIKDDLINSKLNIGLINLGLQPELYLLGISETVFALMGIKDDEKGEELFEHYLELRQKVEGINFAQSYDSLDDLAVEIYNDLLSQKKIKVD
ncbi:MAG: hypothetical protein IM600_17115 [Bacteroidetes bacterium]|nr:hypothetical protein [Bacteroidota bacterium]MCA6445152.1 hypothetical protein [Bacteroidota bacterium]